MHPNEKETPTAIAQQVGIEEKTEENTPPPYSSPNPHSSPNPSFTLTKFNDDLAEDHEEPCRAARPTSMGMLTVNPNYPDNSYVESGRPAPLSRTGSHTPLYAPCSQYKVGSRVQECTMWPSREALQTKAKQEKTLRRGNNCFGLSAKWGSLTRKQKFIIRALIVFFVIAIAVGVAVGISRAVGGTVYSSQGGTKTIGN